MSSAIELELFRHLLVSIAEEMGVVLRRSSYSANIKERRDYSCRRVRRTAARPLPWATTCPSIWARCRSRSAL